MRHADDIILTEMAFSLHNNIWKKVWAFQDNFVNIFCPPILRHVAEMVGFHKPICSGWMSDC